MQHHAVHIHRNCMFHLNIWQQTCIALQVQDDEFDTTIQGPWMKKWEIVHMNPHTEKHEKIERTKS